MKPAPRASSPQRRRRLADQIARLDARCERELARVAAMYERARQVPQSRLGWMSPRMAVRIDQKCWLLAGELRELHHRFDTIHREMRDLKNRPLIKE